MTLIIWKFKKEKNILHLLYQVVFFFNDRGEKSHQRKSVTFHPMACDISPQQGVVIQNDPHYRINLSNVRTINPD
jgi:hypothetical protein